MLTPPKPSQNLELPLSIPLKFITVLICQRVEVEINVMKNQNHYLINIVVTPTVEITYKKTNGLVWTFDTEEEAWDFIDAHQEFNTEVILIELEKDFAALRHSNDLKSEYQKIYHIMLNIKESLGVHRIFPEIVKKNSHCSLRVYAKYVYCRERFGGYGYFYSFGYYEDRNAIYVNITAKEMCRFVDLNLPINQILNSLDLQTLYNIIIETRRKTIQTLVSDNLEVENSRFCKIENLTIFIGELRKYI